MLHSRMDISQTTNMIINATHSVCRYLSLIAFFALIIQISLFIYDYNTCRMAKKKIFNIEKNIYSVVSSP